LTPTKSKLTTRAPVGGGRCEASGVGLFLRRSETGKTIS
jgi:hypothetical protein